MTKESFGGRPSYFSDFELADDLTPDPFSEEPMPHTQAHSYRLQRSKKVKNIRKQEKTGDNIG
ncbi:hypothetical protein BN3661_00313 [Eubacteriaceae bacterium CHKCI005]|uniref:Uncharacterized protein n=1 Tax=Solibaculum mannosilyticum TaxID=2780922 RepID=A0A7I8CYB0_9FIRM|nr:hypothetical protein [Solibaculum mannosilyticum]BCI59461.1 hypothetical protein C12CBH8_01000 [Solibaculum mannosilyticum]CZT55242.1 hypothetical protein BN3661_00313 [Eubacteriaceae bacterium CHKCI005]